MFIYYRYILYCVMIYSTDIHTDTDCNGCIVVADLQCSSCLEICRQWGYPSRISTVSQGKDPLEMIGLLEEWTFNFSPFSAPPGTCTYNSLCWTPTQEQNQNSFQRKIAGKTWWTSRQDLDKISCDMMAVVLPCLARWPMNVSWWQMHQKGAWSLFAKDIQISLDNFDTFWRATLDSLQLFGIFKLTLCLVPSNLFFFFERHCFRFDCFSKLGDPQLQVASTFCFHWSNTFVSIPLPWLWGLAKWDLTQVWASFRSDPKFYWDLSCYQCSYLSKAQKLPLHSVDFTVSSESSWLISRLCS